MTCCPQLYTNSNLFQIALICSKCEFNFLKLLMKIWKQDDKFSTKYSTLFLFCLCFLGRLWGWILISFGHCPIGQFHTLFSLGDSMPLIVRSSPFFGVKNGNSDSLFFGKNFPSIPLKRSQISPKKMFFGDCVTPQFFLQARWSSTKGSPTKAKSVWGCLPLWLHYKVGKKIDTIFHWIFFFSHDTMQVHLGPLTSKTSS